MAYQVRIKRCGRLVRTKTFRTRTAAREWARRYITLPVVQAIWEDLKTEDSLSEVFIDAIEAIPPLTMATLSIGTKATA